MMNNIVFVDELKKIVNKYKTCYVLGGIGQEINRASIMSFCNRNDEAGKYNNGRKQLYEKMSDQRVYAFDCVGLIKAVLWGWKPGVVPYGRNGIPDIASHTLMSKCINLTTSFDTIDIGEAVFMKGHVGVYIGNGEVIESTPMWSNGVQITKLTDRQWINHGKIPYVDYESKGEIMDKKNVEDWKLEGLRYLANEDFIDYTHWKDKLDEPMPAWAILLVLSRIAKKL